MVIFQQLLANKHYRLRDSKFGRAEIWFSSPTWQKKKKNKPRAEQEPRSAHGRAVKKINPVQSKNRARPMAARLIKKNKPRAEQEPRSAHGRAVKKKKTRAEQEPRSAHGRAVKNKRRHGMLYDGFQNYKGA